MKISFRLNNEQKNLEVEPATRLSDVLRTQLGLTATKVGCNAGDCGSCTILIDGEIACSCLTSAAQAQGTYVETLEGVASNGALKNLQESFLHFGAAQCGICTPGMLISAKALLDVNPKPDRQQVEDALGGVLCRCTGYEKIIEAVVNAHNFDVAGIQPEAGAGVGSPIRHLDGLPKVNGKMAYGADVVPENPVFVRVVRSPHHFANFRIGDKDAFIADHDGVLAVYDASDIPGKNSFGVIPPFADQPVFALSTARFRGEAIAAIVCEEFAYNNLDLERFPVEWTPIEHVLCPRKALAGTIIHDGRERNILTRGFVEKGDVAAGLKDAEHTVELETTTPFIEHGYIEPEAGYCIRNGDRLELYGCTQAAQMDREELASIMNLPLEAVRVMPSACGGGFGSKLDISFQPYIALAAWKLNRPAAIVYSRTESMQSTTKRHPSQITIKVGCDNNGLITGFDFQGMFNTGAYASWGPTVANRVPVHASGPYFMKNYRAEGIAIHTNTPPSGAFRGFGVPQAAIAQEVAFDRLAIKARIDRLEFRLRNALRNNQPTATGQVFQKGVGIVECLEAIRPHWKAANKRAREYNKKTNGYGLRKGVGIGTCWYGCGNTSLPNPSTIRFGIKKNGEVVLHQGAMDIGQGANTVITQIASDALGVPVHSITIIDGDTDLTPDCGKTSASRQTYVTGMAAKLAGAALRKEILRQANVGSEASFSIEANSIAIDDGGNLARVELENLDENEFGYVLMAEETYDPPTSPLDESGQGIPYAVYGYGAQIMELTVDTKLGSVKLDKITTAHDVGRAINPLLIEGQIEGGVAQGIGLALMEDYIPGRTENLHDYLMPTIGDMPEFENIIVEVEDAEGPYGAKGLGEHVLIPTAPAILGAIYDATGALIANLPATPDKVLAAIKSTSGD